MEIQRLGVDIEQATRALNTSPWTIRRQITDGKLKPVRLGRKVFRGPSELRGPVQNGRERFRPLDSQWPGDYSLPTENYPSGRGSTLQQNAAHSKIGQPLTAKSKRGEGLAVSSLCGSKQRRLSPPKSCSPRGQFRARDPKSGATAEKT